jgi:hypothetical protein
VAAEELLDPSDVPLPADEARALGREVGGRLQGADRWELRGKHLDGHLEDALGVGEVLQAVLAQVPKADTRGEGSGPDQLGGGAREQDLAPMTGRGDAGGPVDVDADVVVAPHDALARVHTQCAPGRSPRPAM